MNMNHPKVTVTPSLNYATHKRSPLMNENEILSGAKTSKNSNPNGNDHFLKSSQEKNQHHLTR
jgi:hypothetical protein